MLIIIGIMVAVSVVATILLAVLIPPKKNNDPFRRQELTAQYAFEGYAENLRQMAAMKEKCGHLFEPAQWVGCTNLPVSWPADTYNLDHLMEVGSDLRVWLNKVSSIVDAECENEAPCRQWLEEKKRKESEPPLNATFEEVNLQ